jgi:hypothetical protein
MSPSLLTALSLTLASSQKAPQTLDQQLALANQKVDLVGVVADPKKPEVKNRTAFFGLCD